jgi:hypothetical protein
MQSKAETSAPHSPPRSGLVQLQIYGTAFRDINIRKGRLQDEDRSFKTLVLGCDCFVPEPGQNIHRPLSKKKQAGFEMAGLSCQCLVLVHSDFDS